METNTPARPLPEIAANALMTDLYGEGWDRPSEARRRGRPSEDGPAAQRAALAKRFAYRDRMAAIIAKAYGEGV